MDRCRYRVWISLPCGHGKERPALEYGLQNANARKIMSKFIDVVVVDTYLSNVCTSASIINNML